jgi:predicted amidohydrolase YtcJ
VWTGASTGAAQPGAVAIKDGRILAVGDSAEIMRYLRTGTEIISAAGGMVMPGFADGHTHFVDGGFNLTSVDLRSAAIPQEFTRRLRDYARTLKPGECDSGRRLGSRVVAGLAAAAARLDRLGHAR